MTIWIAKFLGPIILVLSIPMIVTPGQLEETTRRFLEDRPLILISGMLAMVAGLAIVNTHNVWEWNWSIIVTLFGWALVLGGALRILAPGIAHDVGGAMIRSLIVTRVAGMIWAFLGVFLTYKAYA